MVGMGVTIVLILAVGGVGVWYWLRIKETSSHEKVEDKTPPRIPQEPIFGEDLINSGDIKVDEIKKTSPPVEEPQSESQSPEETIEEVQEVRENLLNFLDRLFWRRSRKFRRFSRKKPKRKRSPLKLLRYWKRLMTAVCLNMTPLSRNSFALPSRSR